MLADVERLASADLGDFVTFRLTRHEESLDENGYSRLLKLRYATFVGDEEKDPILIDLSLDCEPTCPPERLTPANRVAIGGVVVADYLAYPLPDQLADKLCAIMELQPGGWRSSRMKDLVDVVIYATHEDFRLSQLRRAVRSECAKRGMDVPERFAAPEDWRGRFPAFARRNGLRAELAGFEAATSLAAGFFGPALADEPGESRWDHDSLAWV